MATFQSHRGLTCAHIHSPDGCASTQGWAHGFDNGTEHPLYLSEVPLVYALNFARNLIDNITPTPAGICVVAGTSLSCGRLLNWFDAGSMDLQTAAASDIIALCTSLAANLPCPLSLSSADPRPLRPGNLNDPQLDDVNTMNHIARQRILRWVLPEHPSLIRWRLLRWQRLLRWVVP